MTPSRSYATAGAFRRALEERLKGISQAEQVDLNRLRRQVSFDRLLARLFRNDAAPRVLKGGYAFVLLIFVTVMMIILQKVLSAHKTEDIGRAKSVPMSGVFLLTVFL